jgi:hypothetical protein
MLDNFFGKYSNTWGHLIMSVLAIMFCIVAILTMDPAVKGTAISIATLVIGYWFGSTIPKVEQVHNLAEKEGLTNVTNE